MSRDNCFIFLVLFFIDHNHSTHTEQSSQRNTWKLLLFQMKKNKINKNTGLQSTSAAVSQQWPNRALYCISNAAHCFQST